MEPERAPERSLYPPRPGADLEPIIASFEAEPEYTLTPEELEHVRSFETDLTRSENLPLPNGEHAEGIERIWSKTIRIEELSADYFLTTADEKLNKIAEGSINRQVERGM